MLLLAACSGGESPKPAPVEPTPAPEVAPTPPPATPAPGAGESKVLELDATGGGAGAPAGTNFILPAGSQATATAGKLSDGSTGFTLSVQAAGDALVCAQAVDVGSTLGVKARLKVSGIRPGPQDWMGMNLEVRARDATGALISPPGGRYVLLRNLRQDMDWADVTADAAIPAGATRAEVCFRFVSSTGTLEVDRMELTGTGGAGGATAEKRWDLDQPGGTAGAPAGAAFFLAPGTEGATTKVGDLGGASGFNLTVTKPGNALACTEPFPAAGKMEAKGRARVKEIAAGGGAYSGFTAEIRSYDATGGLVPAPGSQYIPLNVWKQPGDWQEFQVGFTAPPGAVTGKVCVRFVESTGSADVDWLAVAGGAPADAVTDAAPATH